MSERLNSRMTGHLIDILNEWLSEYRAIFIHSADEPDIGYQAGLPQQAREKCLTADAVLFTQHQYKMKEPIFVAFATQKGGAGKSTLTTLVASYLHYVIGKKVLALDCDARQHTMIEYRNKDLLMLRENPAYERRLAKFMTSFGGDPYGIIKCSPSDAIKLANEEIAKGYEADYVFFDITGTVNDNDLVSLLANMDYLFVPVTPETGDLKSSLSFANNVNETMLFKEGMRIKGLHLVWNKVQPKDRSNLVEIINRYMSTLCLEALDTVLPLSVKYTKDGCTSGRGGIFRSTFLPPDKSQLRNSCLPELVDEILGITNPENYGG